MSQPELTNTDPVQSRSSGFRSLFALAIRLSVPLLILGAGVSAGLYFSIHKEKEKTPPAEERAIRTRVTKLTIRDHPVVIETNGIIQPHNEVTLSAQVGGEVKRVSTGFEVGSYFKAGDLLIELDDRDLKTTLQIAEAQLEGARAALELATIVYERNVKLFEQRGVSEAEVNQAKASQSQAAAELDSAAAQVERAKRDLERTRVIAPFDGRVRQKLVGVGQTVSAGMPLGVVFAIDFAEVRLPISAKELQYVELPESPTDPPIPVELRDAINQDNPTVWKAQIVRTEGALDENSLELFAIARIEDPFGRSSGLPALRIAQPVVASITGKTLRNVVAVPRNAIRELNQVYFVDEKELTLSSKTIEPLWSNKDYVFVLDPTIPDGQLLSTTRIVYPPDGAKVEIIPEIDPTTATVKTHASTENSTN